MNSEEVVQIKAATNDPHATGDCPTCHTVLMTLEEKNIPYKTIMVDTREKPAAKLPLLKHRDTWVHDFDAISQVLENKYPTTSLVTPPEYASIGSNIYASFLNCMESGNPEDDGPEKALQDEFMAFNEHLKAKGPFILGEKVTAADLSLVPKLYHVATVLSHFKDWKLPKNVPFVRSYMETFFNRDSFVKTKTTKENVISGWERKLRVAESKGKSKLRSENPNLLSSGPSSPHEEKDIISSLEEKAKSNIIKGDDYYLVCITWWLQWKMYVKPLSPNDSSTRPGPIDNSRLIDKSTNELRPELRSEYDYISVSRDVWFTLKKWYGGGPTISGKITIASIHGKKLFVLEMNPQTLILNEGSKRHSMTISKQATVGDLYQQVSKLLQTDAQKIHLWGTEVGRKRTRLLDCAQHIGDLGFKAYNKIWVEHVSPSLPQKKGRGSATPKRRKRE